MTINGQNLSRKPYVRSHNLFNFACRITNTKYNTLTYVYYIEGDQVLSTHNYTAVYSNIGNIVLIMILYIMVK